MSAPVLAQDAPDWENAQVVGINKLDPHAPVYPFADGATAATLDRAKSPFYRSRPTRAACPCGARDA